MVAAAYTAEAFEYDLLARYTPLVAGTLATVLFAALTVRELVRLRRAGDAAPDANLEYGRTIESQDMRAVTVDSLRAGAFYAGVIVLFVVATWFLGLRICAPVFVAVFMLLDRRTSNVTALLSALGVVVAMYLLSLVGLEWPQGVLTGF